MISILGLDPGGQTGWCFFKETSDSWIWAGDTITQDNHHSLLRALIQRYSPDIIICEDFQFRQQAGREKYRKGLNLISRNYIGVVELIAEDHDIRLIMQQPPVKDTNLVRDDNLKKLGIFREPPHPNRHYHDASRHVAHYLIQKRRYQPFIDRIKNDAA